MRDIVFLLFKIPSLFPLFRSPCVTDNPYNPIYILSLIRSKLHASLPIAITLTDPCWWKSCMYIYREYSSDHIMVLKVRYIYISSTICTGEIIPCKKRLNRRHLSDVINSKKLDSGLIWKYEIKILFWFIYRTVTVRSVIENSLPASSTISLTGSPHAW